MKRDWKSCQMNEKVVCNAGFCNLWGLSNSLTSRFFFHLHLYFEFSLFWTKIFPLVSTLNLDNYFEFPPFFNSFLFPLKEILQSWQKNIKVVNTFDFFFFFTVMVGVDHSVRPNKYHDISRLLLQELTNFAAISCWKRRPIKHWCFRW